MYGMGMGSYGGGYGSSYGSSSSYGGMGSYGSSYGSSYPGTTYPGRYGIPSIMQVQRPLRQLKKAHRTLRESIPTTPTRRENGRSRRR
jgi:hypothetical protein